jgi:3-phenylpropionate/trans-cinnamate dioxygenase ferredoxin subunit
MIPVMPMAALAEGEMAATRVGAEDVLIANVHGQYYAVSNRCTHAGRPLSGGILRGYELTCPAHGATFDVRTGAPLNAPAETGLKRFAVALEAGKINLII